MSQRFCHHVNPAGVFCGCPPVNKRNYCFWHLHETGRRMRAARARARSQRVFIQLPVLDDLHAVQVGLMQLAEAIAHGEIDHQSGRLMLGVLRLAAANLKSLHGWQAKSDFQTFGVDANIVIEEPGFERQYSLPEDFNLEVEPEAAFPLPAEPPAQTARSDQQAQVTHSRRPRRDHHRREQKRKDVSSPSSTESHAEQGQAATQSRKPPQPAAPPDVQPSATQIGT